MVACFSRGKPCSQNDLRYLAQRSTSSLGCMQRRNSLSTVLANRLQSLFLICGRSFAGVKLNCKTRYTQSIIFGGSTHLAPTTDVPPVVGRRSVEPPSAAGLNARAEISAEWRGCVTRSSGADHPEADGGELLNRAVVNPRKRDAEAVRNGGCWNRASAPAILRDLLGLASETVPHRRHHERGAGSDPTEQRRFVAGRCSLGHAVSQMLAARPADRSSRT